MERSQTQVTLEVDAELCKGCGLCVDTCPERVLTLSPGLNRIGYHPVEYVGEGCTGCALCFYCCPEPGALRIHHQVMEVAASIG